MAKALEGVQPAPAVLPVGPCPLRTEAEGSGARAPDPDMTPWELDTLRVMAGETVPGWVGGAAANVAASWLKGRGYAEGFYTISQKGRDYLAALANASGSEGGAS